MMERAQTNTGKEEHEENSLQFDMKNRDGEGVALNLRQKTRDGEGEKREEYKLEGLK